MALRLEDKKALVAEVNEVAARALSAVAAEYRGLSAGQFDILRKKARENAIYLHVVKNTLAKRAVQGTAFECMSPALVGPLVAPDWAALIRLIPIGVLLLVAGFYLWVLLRYRSAGRRRIGMRMRAARPPIRSIWPRCARATAITSAC